jgi:hypothetical protein
MTVMRSGGIDSNLLTQIPAICRGMLLRGDYDCLTIIVVYKSIVFLMLDNRLILDKEPLLCWKSGSILSGVANERRMGFLREYETKFYKHANLP